MASWWKTDFRIETRDISLVGKVYCWVVIVITVGKPYIPNSFRHPINSGIKKYVTYIDI